MTDRFSDSRCMLQSDNGKTSIFPGSEEKRRMDQIRNSIVRIRNNWEKYDYFTDSLFRFFPEAKQVTGFEEAVRKKRNWCDYPIEGFTVPEDYEIVTMYTNREYYNQFFFTVNELFRDTYALSNEDKTDACVFLIELINVDLYNYITHNKEANNFSGNVYRGMYVTENIIDEYKTLLRQPIEKRNYSTPLRLVSASLSRDEALKFTKDRSNNHQIPLLMDIHIYNMEHTALKEYKRKYPESIITSLCSVPVYNLSQFTDEREVLLRGPFFQAIDLRHDPETNIYTLDLVMMNSNRDHIVTMLKLDDKARDDFGKLNRTLRYIHCADLCKKRHCLMTRKNTNA